MITSYLQKTRLFSRNMRLVLVFIVFFGFSFMGIYMVLLNLYLLRLGFGPEYIGLLWSVCELVNALACLPIGLLVGRMGLRRTMIAGVCLGIAGFIGIPLTEIIPQAAQGVWATVMNALTGLSYALWVTAIGPFMISATSDEDRDHAFAMYFALVPLGAFVGSLVGGLLPGIFAAMMGMSLDNPAPYRYPLLLAALLLLPGLAALVATREGRAAEEGTTVSLESRAPVALITVMVAAMLLQAAAGSAASTFFNVYLDTDLAVSTARIGFLAAIAQLLSVPAPLLVPALAARWDRRYVVGAAALGTALSTLPLALIPHWSAAGVGYIGTTALMMMWLCVIFPYAMSLVSARWQGTMSGAGSLATGLNSSIVALAGGYTAATLGFRSLFLMAAGLTVVGVVLFWAYFRGPRGEPAQT